MVWVIITVLAIVLDQLTKFIVERNIEFGTSIPVIDSFFYLAHWKNTGAAWGILQNGRILFIPLTIVVSAIIIYYIRKSNSKLLSFSLSLILGGAVGNLIDRIWRASVVDFFEFHFGSYVFPIFNAADSFVVVGTIVLAYYLIFIYKEN